eukprot:jgi/Tetstr1/427581/TSEL_017707.t1
MEGAALDQLRFMDGELTRIHASGAWEEGHGLRWISRVFLVPEPGVNKWLFIIDLRPLNRYSSDSIKATMMKAAPNLCGWKLKHNIKTAAFERLSKMLKKNMLPKDGSEVTKTWYRYHVEQCMNVPDL